MLRFGPYEFEPAARRVTHGGQTVHLTPKAFDLLQLLIEAAPRCVPKQELHERLWPDHVVSDATLVGLVKELRRALRDSDEERRIIRTVHRVGYAFDAPLKNAPDSAATRGLLIIGRRRARLIEGENLIGRDPACQVWIDNATVSRRHARVVVASQGIALEDLGSKNGTRIDDQPVRASHLLIDGARIRFGGVEAIYRDSPSHLPTRTQLSMTE